MAKTSTTGKISQDFKLIQRIIKKILSGPPVSYPLQVKLLKKLFDQYNNKEFWLWYKPNIEIDSLVYLISSWGQKDLQIQYTLFTTPPVVNEPIIQLGEKCGEDKEIVKTKKTIADWLK